MATGFYSHADCMLHDMGQWHPECPARLQAIEDQLIASRIDSLIERESPPLADEAALLRVHTQAHVDYIRSSIARRRLRRNRPRYVNESA